jgi:hypothetical protein
MANHQFERFIVPILGSDIPVDNFELVALTCDLGPAKRFESTLKVHGSMPGVLLPWVDRLTFRPLLNFGCIRT